MELDPRVEHLKDGFEYRDFAFAPAFAADEQPEVSSVSARTA
jgi:hypothetical protein